VSIHQSTFDHTSKIDLFTSKIELQLKPEDILCLQVVPQGMRIVDGTGLEENVFWVIKAKPNFAAHRHVPYVVSYVLRLT